MALPVEIWDTILVETDSIQSFMTLACVSKTAAAAVDLFVKTKRGDAVWMLYLTEMELKKIADKVNARKRTEIFGKRVLRLLMASSGAVLLTGELYPRQLVGRCWLSTLLMQTPVALVPIWVAELLARSEVGGHHAVLNIFNSVLSALISREPPQSLETFDKAAALGVCVVNVVTRQAIHYCSSSLRLKQYFVDTLLTPICQTGGRNRWAVAAVLVTIAKELPATLNWMSAPRGFNSSYQLFLFIARASVGMHLIKTKKLDGVDAMDLETLKQWQNSVIAKHSIGFSSQFGRLWTTSISWQRESAVAATVADYLVESLRANLHHLALPEPNPSAEIAKLEKEIANVPSTKRKVYDEILAELKDRCPTPAPAPVANSVWKKTPSTLTFLVMLAILLLLSFLIWRNFANYNTIDQSAKDAERQMFEKFMRFFTCESLKNAGKPVDHLFPDCK